MNRSQLPDNLTMEKDTLCMEEEKNELCGCFLKLHDEND